MKDGLISTCEDLNGNIYHIPPFILTDPIEFAQEKRVKKPK